MALLKAPQRTKFAPPTTVWIEPTNACNLKCSWCFQANGAMTRPLGMMTFETFKRAVSEIESFKPQVNLHLAGESFLHRELFEFVKYAKAHGLKVAMTTNGTLLKKNDFGILDSGIDEVNVSMAGVSSEDYLRVRGMKNYDEVRQNIVDLAGKKTQKKWQTEVFVNATATEQNRNEVPAFQSDFGSVEGVNGVLIRSLMDWQGTVDVANMEMRSGFVSRVKMFVKSHGRLFSFYLKARGAKNKVVSKKGEIPSETLCDAPYTSAGILWDGTVVPCCLDYNGTIPLGNINKSSFMEIWNGEPMNELREMLKSVEATKQHLTCGPCRGL